MKMMKKCPGCGNWHEPNAMSCPFCFTDLLGVRAENVDEIPSPDEQTQSGEQAQSGEQNSMNEILVQCPTCGKLSPYSLFMCDCGTSLIGLMPIMPGELNPSPTGSNPGGGNTTSAGTFGNAFGSTTNSTSRNPEKAVSFTLQSDDGQYKIEITNGQELFFGREATGADYLYNKSFVSRRHAKLAVIGGELVITHISSSNPTLVNGKALQPNAPFRLQAGDTVVMGARENQGYLPNAAYFTIH